MTRVEMKKKFISGPFHCPKCGNAHDSRLLCAGRTVEESEYKYVLHPVPEMCPVEELTEDEREELISLYNTFYEKDDWDAISDGLLEMIKRSDEIRSKPRETPKEKWIRGKIENDHPKADVITMSKNALACELSEAYEAGKREREGN